MLRGIEVAPPAGAWIETYMGVSLCCGDITRLPRTRGDGPCVSHLLCIVARAPPHTRGWTPPGGRLGKYFFSKGLSGIINIPLLEQVQEMNVLGGKLKASDNEELKAFAEPIETKEQSLADGIPAYKEAVRAATVSFGEVLQARSEWIRAYEKFYGELIARLGKSKSEKFFKKHRTTAL